MTVTREHARGGRRHRPNRERGLAAGPPRPKVTGGSEALSPRPGAWSRPWQPLAGPALLDRLRTTGRARPRIDPGFARGLRSLIEAGISSIGDDLAASGRDSPARRGFFSDQPLVVTRERLARALCCPAHQFAPRHGEGEPSVALARGALIAALFRQQVTVGTFGDPMRDGLAALALDDQQAGLVSWIEALTGPVREELRAEVGREASALARRWPALEASWLPRTHESMQVGFAHGAVVLSARVDLVVGRPAEGEASVAVVELVSGARRAVHRADRHFAALLETVRHSAPPFVMATYYTTSGELDVEAVTEELLTTAARRVVAGVGALVADRRGDSDGEGDRTVPAPFCASCSALPWVAAEEGPLPDGARLSIRNAS